MLRWWTWPRNPTSLVFNCFCLDNINVFLLSRRWRRGVPEEFQPPWLILVERVWVVFRVWEAWSNLRHAQHLVLLRGTMYSETWHHLETHIAERNRWKNRAGDNLLFFYTISDILSWKRKRLMTKKITLFIPFNTLFPHLAFKSHTSHFHSNLTQKTRDKKSQPHPIPKSPRGPGEGGHMVLPPPNGTRLDLR